MAGSETASTATHRRRFGMTFEEFIAALPANDRKCIKRTIRKLNIAEQQSPKPKEGKHE